jgi:hypothetical protein
MSRIHYSDSGNYIAVIGQRGYDIRQFNNGSIEHERIDAT